MKKWLWIVIHNSHYANKKKKISWPLGFLRKSRMRITRYISIEFQFPRFDWKFTEAEYAKWGLNFYQIDFFHVQNSMGYFLKLNLQFLAYVRANGDFSR